MTQTMVEIIIEMIEKEKIELLGKFIGEYYKNRTAEECERDNQEGYHRTFLRCYSYVSKRMKEQKNVG